MGFSRRYHPSPSVTRITTDPSGDGRAGRTARQGRDEDAGRPMADERGGDRTAAPGPPTAVRAGQAPAGSESGTPAQPADPGQRAPSAMGEQTGGTARQDRDEDAGRPMPASAAGTAPQLRGRRRRYGQAKPRRGGSRPGQRAPHHSPAARRRTRGQTKPRQGRSRDTGATADQRSGDRTAGTRSTAQHRNRAHRHRHRHRTRKHRHPPWPCAAASGRGAKHLGRRDT